MCKKFSGKSEGFREELRSYLEERVQPAKECLAAPCLPHLAPSSKVEVADVNRK